MNLCKFHQHFNRLFFYYKTSSKDLNYFSYNNNSFEKQPRTQEVKKTFQFSQIKQQAQQRQEAKKIFSNRIENIKSSTSFNYLSNCRRNEIHEIFEYIKYSHFIKKEQSKSVVLKKVQI